MATDRDIELLGDLSSYGPVIVDDEEPTEQIDTQQVDRDVELLGDLSAYGPAIDDDSVVDDAPERKKKSGFWAFAGKGWDDMWDRLAITAAGIERDPETVASLVAEHEKRQQDYVRNSQHKYLIEVATREGKDADEAKGWADTSLAYADMMGKVIWAGITNPKGTLEFTGEQLANQLVPVGGLIGGFMVGSVPGAVAGLVSGDVLIETGAGVIEALHRRGIDTTNKEAMKKAMLDTEVMNDLYQEGLIKGGTIGAVDALSLGMARWIFTGPSRILAKELAAAGVTKPLAKGGMHQALVKEASGDKAVRAAFDKYAKSKTKKRAVVAGTAALGAEMTGEGLGEGLGQQFAWGDVKAADVGLEVLGAFGQSVVQTAIVKSMSEANKKVQDARRATRRAQQRAVMEGEDSGIDPETINEDLARRVAGVSPAITPVISPDMADFEQAVGAVDEATPLDSAVANLNELDNYDAYQAALQAALREHVGETVTIYVALSEQERAVLRSGGRLNRTLRGSLSESAVTAGAGQVVVRVNAPVSSVLSRGNWDRLQLVTSTEGLQLSELIPEVEQGTANVALEDVPNIPVGTRVRMRTYLDTDDEGQNAGDLYTFEGVVEERVVDGHVIKFIRAKRENQSSLVNHVLSTNGVVTRGISDVTRIGEEETAAPPVVAQLERVEQQLARAEQDRELDTQTERGELEEQAARSASAVKKEVNEAKKKAGNKRRQLRDPEGYPTVKELQAVVDKNKIPVRPEARKKRPPLAIALNNYRKALANPSATRSVNAVLAPTGYKVVKRKDGVHIVPTTEDGKKKLRVSHTGNSEVGQSTVDDYLFWIREETAQKKPPSTEKTQDRLRKEAEREKGRTAPSKNVREAVQSIEANFVSRDGTTITVDEENLEKFVAETKRISGWTKSDKASLDRYVKTLRREQELAEVDVPTTPLEGRRTIVHSTDPGPLASLKSGFKRFGQRKFHSRSRRLIHTKMGKDTLLSRIAGVFVSGKTGAIRQGAKRDPASILTLSSKTDSNKIAKAYALAVQYIYLRDSVSWIRPDNALNIENDDVRLGVHVRFASPLISYNSKTKKETNVRESQLLSQLKEIFGDDVSYTRIGTNEAVITSDKLSALQLARRFGRFRTRRNDITKSELFTAQSEEVSHNWAEDPAGEGIRNELRQLGFGDLLAFLDDRRASYLNLAEEFGAQEVDQFRPQTRAPPAETTEEETATEATSGVAFSLSEGLLLGEDGQPLILYHGTTEDIADATEIRPSLSGEFGPGAYASNRRESAEMFGGRNAERGQTVNVIQANVRMENPFIVTKTDWIKRTERKTPKEVQSKLKNEGYDGIIGIGINGIDRQYVVFDPAQFRPLSTEATSGVAFSLLAPTTGQTEKTRTVWNRVRDRGEPTRKTIANLADRLTEHHMEVYGRPLDLTDPKDFAIALNVLSAEMKYQLQQEETGEQWYSKDVAESFDIIEKMIPTIQSQDLSTIHSFIAAILSVDKTPETSWRNASVITKAYADTGIVPFVEPTTNQQLGYPLMAQQLRMLNNMLQDWGPERVSQWLLEEHSVREIDHVRRKYGGMGRASGMSVDKAQGLTQDTKMYMGSDVIGPKTGVFFKNVMGISDAETITIDKWATRTINRIIGRTNTEKHGPWTSKLSDQGMVDTPRHEHERRVFQRLYVEAGKRNGLIRTLKDGTIDYTDVQAVPWFYEQQLFTSLGVTSKPLGHSNGAKKVLQQFNEGRIPDNFSADSIQQTNARAIRKIKALRGASIPAEEETPRGSLTPPEQPAIGGLSASEVRRALVKRFGRSGVSMLEAQGLLKIVNDVNDLPSGLINDSDIDAAQRARALFDPKTNTSYLIANRLNESTAPKVLLHEVGVHYSLRRMLGNDVFADIVSEIQDRKNTTFKPWFDKVRNAYEGRLNENSEAFVEEVIAHLAEDQSDVTLPIRGRIWRAIRLFLNRHFNAKLPSNLTDNEIGYVVRGALQKSMRGQLPRHMLLQGGETKFGSPVIAFPEYGRGPTRRLSNEHRTYIIASPTGDMLPKSEEARLRRNMNGMLKVAESVAKKGYKDIDVHLPIVSPTGRITSRYAIFKNTRTGTELVIRVSNHPKDMYTAAATYPFISYNNAHKIDGVNFSDIEKGVKLLSAGRLEGMNGLEFHFEHKFGDPVKGVAPDFVKRNSYSDFKRAAKNKSREIFQRITNAESFELTSSALIADAHPMFSIAPVSETEAEQAVITRATGDGRRRSLSDRVEEGRHEFFGKFLQNWVDAYRPIRNKLGDQGRRAWMMMQLSNNAHGMMHAVLHFGRPTEETRNGKFDWYSLDTKQEGLIDILSDLNGETDRFLTWIVGNRSSKLAKEGRELTFSGDEIDTMMGLNKGEMADGRKRTVVYMQAMKKISGMQKAMLDMALNAGVISKELRAELQTDFYIPFYREFDQETDNVRGPSPAHDFVNIKDVVHKLRGSELEVNDVLHNLVMNWNALISASMKNRAGVAAMEAAVMGGAATEVTSKKDVAQLAFSKGASRSNKFDRFVYTLKDGKRVWYEVHDPLVLNAMSHLAWGGADGKALRTLAGFKRVFTYGVTASPAFKIRNLIRDTVHSVAVGKLNYNIFGNVAGGWGAVAMSNPIKAEMLAAGGTFEFGFLNDDPAALRRAIDAGISEARIINTTAKARNVLGKMWGSYQELGNRMENVNRAALYMKRRDEVGHMQASFEARDLLNFAQHGRSIAAQYLMASMPFLSARLNGLDKMARASREDKGRFLSVVGAVVLASVLFRLSNEGDEEWEGLPEYVKNTYWAVKDADGGFWYIPKPFEIGAMATVAERIAENFIREMGPGSKYTRERIMEVIGDQLAFDWRPQIIRPAYEVATNKDAFKDRRIESLGWQMARLPKHERMHHYSSELAKTSSRGMSAAVEMLGGDPEKILSPVQIDHLIEGYFGWIGATIVGGVDVMIEPFQDGPVAPTERWDQKQFIGPIPFPVGSVYKAPPIAQQKYVDMFYEQMNEIRRYHAMYTGYKSKAKYEEARAVARDHRDVLVWRKNYEAVNRVFSANNKRLGAIHQNKNMSADEKRKEIDRLNILKANQAKKLLIYRARREGYAGMELNIERGALGPKGTAPPRDAYQEPPRVIERRMGKVTLDVPPEPAPIEVAQKKSVIHKIEKPSLERSLYSSIFHSEFRNARDRRTPFIRTKHAPKSGSSAYGPLQITLGLMNSAKNQLALNNDEQSFVDRFVVQGEKFLKFGKEPNRPGYEPKYDYGGSGDLDNARDRQLYEQVGQKLLRLVWDQAQGDPMKFVNAWRYGMNSKKDVRTHDVGYYKAFSEMFRLKEVA